MPDKLAISCATKLCGRGNCTCAYSCNHENKMPINLGLVGPVTTCPLEKYNISPVKDTRPWWQIPREETEPSNDELFAVCAECEHGEVIEDGEYYTIEPHNYRICLDCPVRMYIDGRNEAEAEARMS